MHNIKPFNNFTFNLIKLQNYVNKNYTPVRKDDIKLIMFNAVISSYPDQKWMSLEDSFFQNIPSEDIELTIIYTILSYKLGTFFTKCNPLIKTDLINALLIYSVNTILSGGVLVRHPDNPHYPFTAPTVMPFTKYF